MRQRHGYDFGGARLRVEFSRGGHVARESRGPPRRAGFRIRVIGVPVDASWQDLKDFARQVGDVGFADVDKGARPPVGIIEYTNPDDMVRDAPVRCTPSLCYAASALAYSPAFSSTCHCRSEPSVAWIAQR